MANSSQEVRMALNMPAPAHMVHILILTSAYIRKFLAYEMDA